MTHARTTGPEHARTGPDPDHGTGRRPFLAEVRDAVSLRTAALVVGVLLVQLAFVASYVGAFHHQAPHGITVGLVSGSAAQAQPTVQQLNAQPGHPVDAQAVADRRTAVDRIRSDELSGALVVDPSSTRDELLVASAGGTSLATALEQVATTLEKHQGRTFRVTDVVPLQPGDARGLSGFYLVIGWLVGGYLMASLLGVAKGARPANRARALIRLAAAVPYAVASGLGGALIVDQGVGALTGHYWALAGLGTLLVLSSAATTMALQVLLGTLGIGVTVLLFVVLGNPSAGGAYQWPLLPALWRHAGPWLPNGAGTDAVRRIVYFGGHGVTGELLVIAAYVVVGTVVTLLAASCRSAERGRGSSATTGAPRREALLER